MAYVLWRVFMKKYSKVRLGIHRNALPPINSVTPTGRHVRSFDESSWKITDEHAYMSTVAATQCVKSNPSTTGGSTTKEEIIKDEKSGDELSRNEVRKSKTKRVKNYLKKCKDVALGTTSKSSSINDETAKNNPSNTSWYVPNDETAIKDEPKDTNAFITVVTISDDIWETVDDLKPAVDTNLFEQYNNSENLSIEKPNELVEKVREEQDTDVNLDVTVPPCADIASTCVQTELNDSNHLCDLKHSSVFDSSSDVSSEHTLVGDESADDKLHVQLDTKECEVKCDVASLVDRLLGPLYPNFKNTRSVLVRQARDILVCEYMGNISKFETEFCIPAATLLRHVKNKVEFKQNNGQSERKNFLDITTACAPDGWPLSIGPVGISLHLSPLDATLLRHGDCYLCVRTRSAPGLEVALVWRDHMTIGSHSIAVYEYPIKDESTIECSDFQSITNIEMEITNKGDNELTELLQSLLVSVEHAIERIPLDDLVFPCPQCHQYIPLLEQRSSTLNGDDVATSQLSATNGSNSSTGNNSCICQCTCQNDCHNNTFKGSIYKKDTSIQTSPMFELANTIPHIDSDEDPEEAIKHYKEQISQVTDCTGGKENKTIEFSVPKFITDLPEKLFMSGIYLPGTSDKDGKSLIVCDAACIARSGITRYDVVKLLLYYASIAGKVKQENGFTILVLSESSEEAALDVLDKTMATLSTKLKVEQFIIWRSNTTEPKKTVQKTLKSSKLKCCIVTDSTVLEEYITKENLPINEEGIQTHDQLEWFEFFKEFETFLQQCHFNGRALATAMTQIRSEDAIPQIARRHLSHQHRQLTRVISNPELTVLKREGPMILERLEERAQWLTASEDVQIAKVRARRCFEEVARVILRLEQLADQRKERIKELARLRALEEETTQVLKWFKDTGNYKLKELSELIKHPEIDKDIIKNREKQFEEFYFIAVKYMDKASDLFDESDKCIEPRLANIRDLAQMLKLQVRTFGEALEESREYLEELLKYFQLLEHYETAEQLSIKEECSMEMFKIANKLKNESLVEKSTAIYHQLRHNTQRQQHLRRTPHLITFHHNNYNNFNNNFHSNPFKLRSTTAFITKPITNSKIFTNYANNMKQTKSYDNLYDQWIQDHQSSTIQNPNPKIRVLQNMKKSNNIATRLNNNSSLFNNTFGIIQRFISRSLDNVTLNNNLMDTIGNNDSISNCEYTPENVGNGVIATSTPKSTSTASPDEKTNALSPPRRRSISSFAYIYRCNHHAAGFSCNCQWDYEETNGNNTNITTSVAQKLKNTFLKSLQDQQQQSNNNNCLCKEPVIRSNSLGLCNIKEVRESTENLLNTSTSNSNNSGGTTLKSGSLTRVDDKNTDSGLSGCGKCDSSSVSTNTTKKTRTFIRKQRVHRTCSCQFLNINDSCGICNVTGGSSTSTSGSAASNGDHNDNQNDNMTEGGSEGFAKSNTSEDFEDNEEQYRGKTIPPVSVNSHLYCHSSNVHLPSPISNLDSKTQKTLLLIMGEMIQTERDYVKSLDYIIENYIPELTREDIPQALRGQRNVVFGNVEKIYEFHSQHFLRELEERAENPLQVGQCFLRHEKKFYLYALYNKNKPKSDSLMSEYGTAFFKSKQLELKDKMDLASYLLKPVQRMGKYALLLQQLMKACQSTANASQERENADLEDLRSAEQMVRFQLRHGNDLLAMDSLRDCDVNLKEQGRLLRQNEFLVGEGRGGRKHIRQVFLFEELILFSKANRFPDRKNLDLYIYKNSIKMSDIGMTEKIGDSTTKFEIWYRKRKRNDTFVLQAMSEEIKKAWTEEISQLLWKQAMRNREVRLQEMSSMGIGNKPCLDIRPSEDQISDRSISIAQLSKTPKFRNSIAGPIIETCRSNKRPHSIISVSSLSSGSTSSGSGGTLGRHQALPNMHFDSASCVSPKPHHRSTLNSQCSTESGILIDYSVTSDDYTESTPNNNSSSTHHHWPLQKSNSDFSTLSSSKSNNTTASISKTDEPQVTLYHVPDDLSINL